MYGCPCDFSENVAARFEQSEQRYVLLWLVCKNMPRNEKKKKKKRQNRNQVPYTAKVFQNVKVHL